uniref:WT5.5 n=1 Tax=Streptomyces sp. WT5 TaxID=1126600 RepID=G9HVX6_9ACTN|nr:WT5.5 [Streptomyces sp. WT5]
MEIHSCPEDQGQEAHAATASLLCDPGVERQELERSLRALPGLHQEGLHHVLAPTARRRNPTKVSGSRKRDHLNVAALDARSNIIAILESWAGYVADELGVTAPARSVPHLACFLLVHLDWLTAQPPAADFAEEIQGLHVELLRVIDPDRGERNQLAGQCVVDGCTGTINASPQSVGSAGAKSSISCSSGHSWEIREWLVLRHLMARRREEAA